MPELIKLGKKHLYVLNLSANHLHEDDAALRIARAICGKRLHWTDPVEGKSNIISEADGIVKVDRAALLKINKLGKIIVSTLKNNFPVQKDQIVAATRIIPLTLNVKKIERLENIARKQHPVIRIMPYRHLKVGAVVTGTEIYEGLIQDEFDKYVAKKVSAYGSRIVKKILVPDKVEAIAKAVGELKDLGCDLILTTGGLCLNCDRCQFPVCPFGK